MPNNFQYSAVPFLVTRGPSSCVLPTTLSFQLIFSKFATNIHWTMLQIPVHYCHHLVTCTFVATRGPNAFFLVCDLQPLNLKGFFPNSHQILIGLCSRPHCCHQLVTFVATRRPTFFSCVYSTKQSLQPIFSKFTPNIYWTMLKTPAHFQPLLMTFVAIRGPTSYFTVCTVQIKVFN